MYGSVKIARLGLMHLVATNLWTWIRYILIEEKTTTTELGHANFGSNLIKILHEIEKKDYKIIKFLLCVYVCMCAYGMFLPLCITTIHRKRHFFIFHTLSCMKI